MFVSSNCNILEDDPHRSPSDSDERHSPAFESVNQNPESDQKRDDRERNEIITGHARCRPLIGRRISSSFSILGHPSTEQIEEGLVVMWSSPTNQTGNERRRKNTHLLTSLIHCCSLGVGCSFDWTSRTANPPVGDEKEEMGIDEDKKDERVNLSLEFRRSP